MATTQSGFHVGTFILTKIPIMAENGAIELFHCIVSWFGQFVVLRDFIMTFFIEPAPYPFIGLPPAWLSRMPGKGHPPCLERPPRK